MKFRSSSLIVAILVFLTGGVYLVCTSMRNSEPRHECFLIIKNGESVRVSAYITESEMIPGPGADNQDELPIDISMVVKSFEYKEKNFRLKFAPEIQFQDDEFDVWDVFMEIEGEPSVVKRVYFKEKEKLIHIKGKHSVWLTKEDPIMSKIVQNN